jgi:hypothetical protein
LGVRASTESKFVSGHTQRLSEQRLSRIRATPTISAMVIGYETLRGSAAPCPGPSFLTVIGNYRKLHRGKHSPISELTLGWKFLRTRRSDVCVEFLSSFYLILVLASSCVNELIVSSSPPPRADHWQIKRCLRSCQMESFWYSFG